MKIQPKSIKPFEWEELNGKTLEIVVGKQDGAVVVVGYDKKSKDVYVLYEEISQQIKGLESMRRLTERVNKMGYDHE